nr:MAG TPA: hypothetical protein [Caudoviricetes sp.]
MITLYTDLKIRLFYFRNSQNRPKKLAQTHVK